MIRSGDYPSVDEYERKYAKSQEAAVSTDRASRREVLAFIALQDLPMPATVFLIESLVDVDPAPALRLRFYGPSALSDAQAWAEVLGVKMNPRGYKTDELTEYYTNSGGSWRGLDVSLVARVPRSPLPEEPLDEDTASQLREIAGGDQ